MITVKAIPMSEDEARSRMHQLRGIVESWRDHWHTARESLERAALLTDSTRSLHWEEISPTDVIVVPRVFVNATFESALSAVRNGRVATRAGWGDGWVLHSGKDGIYIKTPSERRLSNDDFTATDWAIT